MITLESGGMPHSKKIVYSISKISILQNEKKQTGPKLNFLYLTRFIKKYNMICCSFYTVHTNENIYECRYKLQA